MQIFSVVLLRYHHNNGNVVAFKKTVFISEHLADIIFLVFKSVDGQVDLQEVLIQCWRDNFKEFCSVVAILAC